MSVAEDFFVFSDTSTFEAHLEALELKQYTKFTMLKTRHASSKFKGKDVDCLDGHKIYFEDKENVPIIPYDGRPFIVVGNEIRECMFGPDHKKGRRNKNAILDSHNYATDPKRRSKASRKVNCPAKVRMRKIIRFPEYQIPDELNNEATRKAVVAKLKSSFKATTLKDYQVYASFPRPEVHQNHALGEAAGMYLPLDKRLIKKIHELVKEGYVTVKDVRVHLEAYVASLNINTPRTNRRFYPTEKDLSNHIRTALHGRKPRKHYAEDMQEQIKMELDYADDDIFSAALYPPSVFKIDPEVPTVSSTVSASNEVGTMTIDEEADDIFETVRTSVLVTRPIPAERKTRIRYTPINHPAKKVWPHVDAESHRLQKNNLEAENKKLIAETKKLEMETKKLKCEIEVMQSKKQPYNAESEDSDFGTISLEDLRCLEEAAKTCQNPFETPANFVTQDFESENVNSNKKSNKTAKDHRQLERDNLIATNQKLLAETKKIELETKKIQCETEVLNLKKLYFLSKLQSEFQFSVSK